MDVVEGVGALRAAHGRLFVVVGVFDGLHLGHRYLLGHLVREAAARDARPAVITFDAHPDAVLTGSAPPLLLDPDDRLERLAAEGVEVTVVERFDATLRDTPFEAFVERIRGRVDLAGFLMTPDAAFGHRRAGTPEALTTLGGRFGFDVVVVPPFALDGRPVRSSDIRAAIAAGELAEAAELLGRPYSVVAERDETDAGSGTGLVLGTRSPIAVPPDGPYRVVVDGREATATLAAGRLALASPVPSGPAAVQVDLIEPA